MKFTVLSPEEFNNHAKHHPNANIFQTAEWGKLREKRGAEISYVGVKEDGQVVASALIAKTKMFLGYFADIDSGLLGDFHNKKLLETFTEGLKNHLKKQNVLYLTMIPPILYQTRGFNGEIVEETDEKALQLLQKVGFIHHGFPTGYSSGIPLWQFVKHLNGLDEESLKESYQKRARRALKKAKKLELTIREMPTEELTKFHQIMEETSQRLNFQMKSLGYFRCVSQTMDKKAKFMAVEFDSQAFFERINQQKKEIQAKITAIEQFLAENPESKKGKPQLKAFKKQLSSLEKQLAEAPTNEKKENKTLLSVGLFFETDSELLFLFGGNIEKYMNLGASHFLQDSMIKYAIQKGIPKYNFYGISGNFDGSDGVLAFKQLFGGNVEQRLGQFDLIIQPSKYKLQRLIKKVLRRS